MEFPTICTSVSTLSTLIMLRFPIEQQSENGDKKFNKYKVQSIGNFKKKKYFERSRSSSLKVPLKRSLLKCDKSWRREKKNCLLLFKKTNNRSLLHRIFSCEGDLFSEKKNRTKWSPLTRFDINLLFDVLECFVYFLTVLKEILQMDLHFNALVRRLRKGNVEEIQKCRKSIVVQRVNTNKRKRESKNFTPNKMVNYIVENLKANNTRNCLRSVDGSIAGTSKATYKSA